MVYRVFLSSPGDVAAERAAVQRAVDRINAEREPKDRFETVQWEHHYYTADSTFQAQIPSAGACDVVIVILWRSLGSPLPESFQRADGTLPTGTEYEFEDALERALNTDERVPSLFVFRRAGEIYHAQSEREESQRQYDLLERFWLKWFRNEQGHFVAAFNWFDDTADIETRTEAVLRGWLREREGASDWSSPPFKGLAAFEKEDAPIFFGRRDEVARARARFLANAKRGHRALFVLGPSGSGKSSILRAGLLPQLEKLGGNDDLVHLDRQVLATPSLLFRDGNPFRGLAKALLDTDGLGVGLRDGGFDTTDDLASILATDGPARVAPLRAALRRATDGGAAQGLLLVLDQFEEIFAWPEAQIADFVALLRALTTQTDIFLICAMRAEFQPSLAQFADLDAMANVPPVAGPDAPIPSLVVRAPNVADYREMIRCPARLAGLTFEGASEEHPDMAARVEAETGPDSLPALQFLLRELYEIRDGDMLTHDAFDRLGGITGVMGRRGEMVLSGLSPAERAQFPSLVRLLVDTRDLSGLAVARVAPHGALRDNPALSSLAEALSEARLLVSDAHGVRLTHESLIGGWDQLRGVVDEERRFFAIREYLVAAHQRYVAARAKSPGRARQALLRGLPLTEAISLRTAWGDAPLAAVAHGLPDFIQRSRFARVMRRGQAGVAALAACAAVAGLFWAFNDLRKERDLIAGLEALEAGRYAEAAAVAQTALDRSQSIENLNFAAAVLRDAAVGRWTSSVDTPVQAMAASPPDATEPFSVLVRNGRISGALALGALGLDGADLLSVMGLSHLPDGRGVVISRRGDLGEVDEGGTVLWLDLPIGPVIRSSQWSQWHGSFESRFALSDGGPDAAVTVVCGAGLPCERAETLPPNISALAYSIDGQQIAVAEGGEDLALYGRAVPPVRMAMPSDGVISLAVLEGARVVAGLEDGGLWLTEAAGVRPIASRASIEGVRREPLIRDPAGAQIAVRCGRQVICSGPPEGPMRLHFPAQIDMHDLIWPNGDAGLASTSFSGGATLWSMEGGARFDLPQSVGFAVTSLAVGAEATAPLVVGDRSGRITALAPNGARLWQHRIDDSAVTSVAAGPHGMAAAVTEFGNFVRIDASGDMAVCGAAEPLLRVAIAADGRAFATSSRVLYRHGDGAGCIRIGQIPQADTATFGGVAVTDAGAVLTSRSDGALSSWTPDPDAPEAAWRSDMFASRADTGSALSLDLSPQDRWLATTRSDETVVFYDTSDGARAEIAPMPPGESKTVAFSPDGRHVAVLGANDWLRVLTFDPANVQTRVVLDLDTGVPAALRTAGDSRQTGWIAWSDPETLVLGTVAGDLVALPVAADAIEARLADAAAHLRAGP